MVNSQWSMALFYYSGKRKFETLFSVRVGGLCLYSRDFNRQGFLLHPSSFSNAFSAVSKRWLSNCERTATRK